MQPIDSNSHTRGRGKNQAEVYADMLVEDLNIPNALARRLCGMGFVTVGQLLSVSVDDLMRAYWIGRGSIGAIQRALREIGLEPLAQHVPRQTIRRIV
jgi:ERCC4-type nuclease